ncbi:MAG: ribose-phosphate pyrophosphokinase [Candidatus Cloacimonadota bacterium]|nr:ribose-phosphate pyrophosphokinase [Candidatus Cloacimonadota bacterium]
MFSKLKLFTGRANPALAKEVARIADIPLGDISLFKFSNDESFAKINENVRGADVFILQPTTYPVNDNLMELLIMVDSIKRASAKRITCIIPYYAYARSDKKDQPRVPITAKLVADLLTVAGADRIVTLDLHADQIQGFFDIPVDHLSATPLFARYIKSLNYKDLVVVSPDSGGANRARELAKRLDCSMAIGDKRRFGNDDKAELMNIIGEVKGKTAILFDDIVDTAGSLTKVANALQKNGAKEIFGAVAHGVLSGNAIEKIQQSAINKMIITDSIELRNNKKKCKKIIQLSIADLLATVMKKIHIEESISILYR